MGAEGAERQPRFTGIEQLPTSVYFFSGTRAESYQLNNLPENVIANLEAAYRSRDIEAFAGLLAPEFTFRFQPDDVAIVGRSSWGLEEELQ